MEHIESFPAAPRKELMNLLDRLAKKRLVFIHAPAGYGKSYSVRMWLRRKDSPWAFVAINESIGSKPANLLKRIAAALLSLQPENKEIRDIVSHKSFTTAPYEFMERAVEAFFVTAHDNNKKYTLVIDDLHLVDNTEINNRIPEFISALPESITLFIISRAKPPDSFSEYIIKDAMAIVGIESLRFTENEIKAFFSACGRPLTARQTQGIIDATDGWAIGLNAILLSGEQLPEKKLILQYLETFIKNQVWDKWDKERRDFLLRVSVADDLTPDFCNAITERTDSDKVLTAMVRENAFISVDKENIYRLHHLFRDFLRHLIEHENKMVKDELYQKTGDWFYGLGDYYKAVEYYIKCGSKKGITKGLKSMYNYNSPYAAIEDTLAVIHLSIDGSIVDEYPFLLEVQAWAAFTEGRGSDMESYLDRYFKVLPKIILQNPASAQTALLLRCMDYRNSMIDITKILKKLPLKLFAQANTPSITENLPLFHRAVRDFSEYAIDPDKNFLLFKKTIGVLVGDEYETIENLIRAGIAYERGNLNEAYELMLTVNVNLKERFAPEIKFCMFMMLASILEAQGHRADVQKILNSVQAMIERDKAYYLYANFRAFSIRLNLSDGDEEVAKNWLKHHFDSRNCVLDFYKLYQHFTTARAYIVTGNYNMAIMFLKKLLSLCEQYHRFIDVIETNILLAISYWKKERGQIEAVRLMENAVILSQRYGYTQIFAIEGAEITNILSRLYKRVIQKNYSGKVLATHLKTLHMLAMARSKHSHGLSGGRVKQNIQFTERQKTVMRYMNESLTQKEIAQKMGLKPSSIKSHVILIYKKLNVSNIMDAMIKIQELNLLDE